MNHFVTMLRGVVLPQSELTLTGLITTLQLCPLNSKLTTSHKLFWLRSENSCSEVSAENNSVQMKQRGMTSVVAAVCALLGACT